MATQAPGLSSPGAPTGQNLPVVAGPGAGAFYSVDTMTENHASDLYDAVNNWGPAMTFYWPSLPGAGRVTWIDGNSRAVPSDARFDVALMTSNVVQEILDDDELARSLADIAAHLDRPAPTRRQPALVQNHSRR